MQRCQSLQSLLNTRTHAHPSPNLFISAIEIILTAIRRACRRQRLSKRHLIVRIREPSSIMGCVRARCTQLAAMSCR
jgi:hypothetical protein